MLQSADDFWFRIRFHFGWLQFCKSAHFFRTNGSTPLLNDFFLRFLEVWILENRFTKGKLITSTKQPNMNILEVLDSLSHFGIVFKALRFQISTLFYIVLCPAFSYFLCLKWIPKLDPEQYIFCGFGHPRALPKRFQNALKTLPKRSKNAPQTFSKRSKNAPQTLPKRSQNALETLPKRSPNAIKTLPKRSPNAVKTL